jgi:YHS domain-containing protein
MQVETATAPASTTYAGERVFFCSDHCRNRFEESPARFVTTGPVLAQPD